MKLTNGTGDRTTGGCWMVAAHWYVTNGLTWSDQPECVSPVIRPLCIRLNDFLRDGERERVIGPHLFTPVGTNTGTADDETRRYLCADRAIRVFAPFWFRRTKKADLIAHADALEALALAVCQALNDLLAIRVGGDQRRAPTCEPDFVTHGPPACM